MKRTLRHPLGGSRHYLRPERERRVRQKAPRQPKLHQSRLSVGSMLDAPDSSASRPGLRLRIVGIAIIALFALLGLRLWTLQVLQAPAAVQAVTANQIRAVPVDPTRGEILDRYGNPLVNNVTTEQITLSRLSAQQHPEVVGRLASLIGETPAQVNAAVNSVQYNPYEAVPILSAAPDSDVLYIAEHQSEFPGVATVQTTQRNYPQLEMAGPASAGYPAAQSLGYVRTITSDQLKANASKGYVAGDQYGQSGLELQYEPELRGTPGQKQLEVDSSGNVVGTLKTTPAVAGDNVVTNIDLGLQQVADDALATQITALRRSTDPTCKCTPAATGGAVVVLNPQTGAVYALSSYPTYNPDIWTGTISDAQYAALNASGAQNNLAIDGLYTPGSTFKLTTATAALNDGLINGNTTIDDTFSFTVPNCKPGSGQCSFHNDDSDGALGYINVSQALTESSDFFFYDLGYMFYSQSAKYGETPIQDQAAQYSLGQLTGIDLPGEGQGRVDSQAERVKLHQEAPTAFPNATWYTGDNIEMAFGQGATVITPIEQAVAYATFANGGTRYAPQVAAAVVTPQGKVAEQMTPQVTGHVSLAPSTYQPMLAGFEGVIQSPKGTAYSAFQGSAFPVNELAGKTGTATTELGKEPTSWFVGWGPTADPQYVVVCVIDQAGYGATASAPVVRQIFDYLAAHPVTAPAIPPEAQITQSTSPVQLPTTTTTTTTTTQPSGAGGTTPTATTRPPGA